MSTATPHFKVLIAGGGVSGLTLALALERAGIDYEVFEKGDIDTDLGASIAIHGPTVRILDQLGVWEDLEPLVTDMERCYRVDGKTGHVILDSDFHRVLQDELHWPIVFLERRILLKAIYNRIQNQSKIHSHAAVIEYDQDADGVVVTTSAGVSCRGDILVGADGIHSHIRTLMSKHTRETKEPLSRETNNTFVTEFQIIFGVSHHEPTASWLADGHTVYLTHGDNHSAIVIKTRPDRVFWFLINKIKRTEYDYVHRLHYTQEDAQALIDERGGLLIVPGHPIRELWDSRIKATLVPMEDGIVKKWNDGRVLLIGDSVHKFTVNAGLGGNMAFEAVAHLTNRLVSLLKQNPRPTSQDLTSLFEEFESAHRPRTEIARNMSIYTTRLESQASWFLKFYARYIMPRNSAKQLSHPILEWALAAPWLEFVPLPDNDADFLAKKEEYEKGQKDRAYPAITWSTVGTGLVLATAAVIWGLRLRRA
ncbi:hypothetical protein DTO021D3_1334 [Paecilomyces variotii]|nr:hypothetical protein DTO032I3_2300 [Paecilomyces variotii]KAJ9282038.1 hypothetical protein DTO021D3_1334 [Paecilomyces variotii]KAJ9286177.1 hypothetical protein DTO021C3_6255 [Paecilomyces variotii]KAJ9342041.1 hypothetical protein DTO027B6_5488 [Paecilomyces variotii]KAJ9388487.1 hypothetical protein DTO032I4_2457 [Paecilomyces variotii]